MGRAGAPSSHNRSGCVSCHDVTTTGPYPKLMRHRGGDLAQCQLCHRNGTADAPKAQHLEEVDCYTCHQATDYGPWPPGVPHDVTDSRSASCLDCHGNLKHAARPTCVNCHGF